MKTADWYYLSFADDSGFKGGCYVQARPENAVTDYPGNHGSGSEPIVLAVREAHRLKINPGGQVMGLGPLELKLFRKQPEWAHRNKLLSKAELMALTKMVHADGTPARPGKRSEYKRKSPDRKIARRQ